LTLCDLSQRVRAHDQWDQASNHQRGSRNRGCNDRVAMTRLCDPPAFLLQVVEVPIDGCTFGLQI
jgi:hypothetical protein